MSYYVQNHLTCENTRDHCFADTFSFETWVPCADPNRKFAVWGTTEDAINPIYITSNDSRTEYTFLTLLTAPLSWLKQMSFIFGKDALFTLIYSFGHETHENIHTIVVQNGEIIHQKTINRVDEFYNANGGHENVLKKTCNIIEEGLKTAGKLHVGRNWSWNDQYSPAVLLEHHVPETMVKLKCFISDVEDILLDSDFMYVVMLSVQTKLIQNE